MNRCIRMIASTLAAILLAWPLAANANDLAPTGTLRAAFIGRNPVQATTDPRTGEVRGPAADITRELARRAGVPFVISGLAGVEAIIESVKTGASDIGFVAFDPIRAAQVDFSQTYSLAQNTYLVPASSPIKSAAEVDRPGRRIGVGARDAGDYFLTRTLKHAELKRNEAGAMDIALKMLAAGEIDVYAANRQRLSEVVARTPGVRLTPDNFYAVEQAVIVPKGHAARLAIVNRFLDAARTSGFVTEAIARAGLVGVDAAPANTRPRE